jgi:predicted DNA-binding transcriptional regulator AlpA
MTNYLDIDELAELLAVKPETIRRDLKHNPGRAPPKMHIPESDMLRWREHEVKFWLDEQRAYGLQHPRLTGWVRCSMDKGIGEH